VVVALLGGVLLALPVVGLLARVPWTDLPARLNDAAVRAAIGLSLWTSLAATGIAVGLGVPIAWVLARSTLRIRTLLRVLAVLPVVLPPVVGGVALLSAFGRDRPVGRVLEAVFGVRLPFSAAGVVVAEAFIAIPFVVLAVEGGLRAADRRLEEAAATLGAGPGRVARRITLPLVMPAIGAGALLAWARALGEFGATITFAGNVRGRTETVPLAVYSLLERDPASAMALSLVLLVVCAAVLVGLRGRWLA